MGLTLIKSNLLMTILIRNAALLSARKETRLDDYHLLGDDAVETSNLT
jgi:hypothetical protein